MKLKVFVVDDDRYYARLLSYKLDKQPHYEVTVFNSGESLLAQLDHPPDLVLLDIMMPGMTGLEVLQRIKAQYPQVPVLVISAQGVIGNAAEAIKLGAYDYVTKGQDDLLRLDVIVKNIWERRELERELAVLRKEVRRRYALEGLIGESSTMRGVNALAERAASSDMPVLIEGERGAGKEYVARAIHFNSSRSSQPFVVLDCRSRSVDSQVLSEAIEEAGPGTLLLNEIGAVSQDGQAALLQATAREGAEPGNGEATPACEARIMAASSEPFGDLVQSGRLDADLHDRLADVVIRLPPLRLRREDVLPLADYLLRAHADENDRSDELYLGEDARRALLQYDWPGNVEELKDVLYSAVQVTGGTPITAADLALR